MIFHKDMKLLIKVFSWNRKGRIYTLFLFLFFSFLFFSPKIVLLFFL